MEKQCNCKKESFDSKGNCFHHSKIWTKEKMPKFYQKIKSKNQKQLDSFRNFCLENPEQRFWQALRNWSGSAFILKADSFDFDKREYKEIKDTFYLED